MHWLCQIVTDCDCQCGYLSLSHSLSVIVLYDHDWVTAISTGTKRWGANVTRLA